MNEQIISKETSGKNKMEKILIKQLESGISALHDDIADANIYEYQKQDLDVTIPILKKVLKNNGYLFLDDNKFSSIIKKVFKGNRYNISNTEYAYFSPNDKCRKDIVYYNNTVDVWDLSFYVIKKDKFITCLYSIPQILDYKNIYPHIAKMEDTININFINKGYKVKINLWKDVSDLDQSRKEYIMLLIHRNKYLFNDNKASFAWLKNKDEYFLKSLVLTFGYVEDKELLKWVINETPLDDIDNHNKLFFYKTCSGKFILHKETFELIEENINEKYLKNLEKYLEILNNDKQEYELSFSQRSMIIAHIINLGENVSINNKNYSAYKGKFIEKILKNKEKYLEEFKTKNYYNLKDLKSIVENM